MVRLTINIVLAVMTSSMEQFVVVGTERSERETLSSVVL